MRSPVSSSACESLEARCLLDADFNGDGVEDFVYRDTTSGEVTVLLLRPNGNVLASRPIATVANQAWQIVDAADYDGDGDGDLLWRNTDTGRLLVWLLDGRKLVGFRSLPFAKSPWQFAAAAEHADSDDHDLLWRNADDGRLVLWLMDGRQISRTVQLSREPDPNWKVAGMSEVRGTGPIDTEILWRNVATGENRIWRIEASHFRFAVELRPLGRTWRIGGLVDADRSRPGKVIWQNTADGQVVRWTFGENYTIDAIHLMAFDPNPDRLLIAGHD